MKIRNYAYFAAIAMLAVIGIGLLPAGAGAAEPSRLLRLSATADNTTARVGDNLTFTYVVSNTGTAAVDNITLRDSRLGAIVLGKSSLAAGENVTAAVVYTVKAADLPGPLMSFAAAAGRVTSGAIVRDTAMVSVELIGSRQGRDKNRDKDDNADNGKEKGGWFWKFDWLKDKGVPGKGIDHAPGLQKFFNWNWKGSDNETDKGKNDKGKGRGGGD